jgi:hypothetical protein
MIKEFITKKEEAVAYRLFLNGNATTPSRFWTYFLFDTGKKDDKSEYYSKHSSWTELNVISQLEKYGKIPLKFLKN